MGKIPGNVLNLKQFLLKQEVISLYRQIMKAIKEVPDEGSRKELREWARCDFKNNKHHTDEITIKMMIQHGQRSLRELKTSVDMSK